MPRRPNPLRGFSSLPETFMHVTKLAEGEGLLRPAASSLREDVLRTSRSLAMPRRPNPLRGFSSLPETFMHLTKLAEGEGFEPPEACASTVFKTAAIDHSATPPRNINVSSLPPAMRAPWKIENARILHYSAGQTQVNYQVSGWCPWIPNQFFSHRNPSLKRSSSNR